MLTPATSRLDQLTTHGAMAQESPLNQAPYWARPLVRPQTPHSPIVDSQPLRTTPRHGAMRGNPRAPATTRLSAQAPALTQNLMKVLANSTGHRICPLEMNWNERNAYPWCIGTLRNDGCGS